MNDTTTKRRLGAVAHQNLQTMIRCVDDPKGMKLTKKLHAKAIADLAKWDAMAQERGWKDAREWLAAGPAPLDLSTVSPETRAAMERTRAAMRAAGIKSSTEVDAERCFGAYPTSRQ